MSVCPDESKFDDTYVKKYHEVWIKTEEPGGQSAVSNWNQLLHLIVAESCFNSSEALATGSPA